MARSFAAGSSQVLQAAVAPVTDYPFTLAGWSYPTSFISGSADKYIFSLADNSVTTRYAAIQWPDLASPGLRVISVFGGQNRTFNTTATGTLDTWQHVAGVFTSASDIVGYVNADGSGSYSATGTPAISGLNQMAIGALVRSSTLAYYFGTLAECGMWSAALTQAELDALAAGYSPLMVRPESLAFYVPMFGRGGASGDEVDWAGGLTLSQTSSPAVVDHPRIIYPRRRGIVVPVAVGGSLPTLSAATYVPGSLAANGWRPRVTAAY